jgi:hypothetical protein
MKMNTERLQLLLLLLVICLDSLQGFQYSSSTTFGVASATQVKGSPSAVSMSKPKEKEEATPPELIFEEAAARIDVAGNSCAATGYRDPDTIQAECNNVEETENVHYDIGIEATYEFNEFISSEENDLKKSKGYISKAISVYIHLLESSALLTKCLTAGFIGGIGDVCAQMFEHKMSSNTRFALDCRRVFGIAFECTAISGPLMHHAYDFLERIVPIHDSESDERHQLDNASDDHMDNTISPVHRWAAAIFHVLTDTFLLGPIYVLSIMATSSLFEGRMSTLKKQLAMDFLPTLKASIYSSLGFMPMQVLAFRMLPSHFRLLYMNIQDIFWNAVVSFMAHKSRH